MCGTSKPEAPAAAADDEDDDDDGVTVVDNFIDGAFVPPSTGAYLPVTDPSDGATIGKVAASSEADVEAAVVAADRAFPAWSGLTIKARAAVMLRFHALVEARAEELARLIVRENGKNLTEARADVAKGNETVEYACSLPQLAAGRVLQVSSGGVACRDERRPLGVVACVVPFNFPFMVPMWTLPIALVLGNCVVLKPSEKVPLTMRRAAELLHQAGVPPGVLGLVQGGAPVAQALVGHPRVRAATFVGSSPVAAAVQARCHALRRRCTALGGAKNHLVALPDCDAAAAAGDITVSFAGCAGQRCMAASVLLLVGEQPALLQAVLDRAAAVRPGTGPGEMGPVIDGAALARIRTYIAQAEADGARVLLDGRAWQQEQPGGGGGAGHWIGPTVLLHASPTDRTMREEVFGPVLSVYVCRSWEEAVAIENANPFGNAASIYTSRGAHADWFTDRFRAAMLGVNIGIPVPREPFSFGGLYGTDSKFGDLDITGDGAIEFFSARVKVTSRWPLARPAESGAGTGAVDAANFAGSM